MEAKPFREKFFERSYLSFFFIFLANIICWQGFIQIIVFLEDALIIDNAMFGLFLFTISIIIFSLIAGKFVDYSFNRRRFILIGFIIYILGFLFAMPVMLGNALFGSMVDISLTSILLGVAFGISSIGIGAYFADISPPEERGKLQGVSSGLSFIITFFFLNTIIFYFFSINLMYVIVSILIVLFVGLIAFLIMYEPSKAVPKTLERTSYSSVFKHKPFIYFAISFLLFMIALPFIQIFIDFGGIPASFDLIRSYTYFPLLAGFGFLGGFLIDRYGRKSMTLVLFLIMGFAFAIWGIIPETIALLLPILLVIWILLTIGNAFTNLVDYIIPADCASPFSRGKYLAVFAVATNAGFLISVLLQPFIITLPIPTIALIVTSLLLFAITPIILTSKPLEEALAKEVDVKGVYVISQDGRCLFEMSFKDVLIDADLITSALSAVGSLIKESIHSEQKLESIDHGDVKILIEYGKVNAAVIADKETPDLRLRLEKFLDNFVYDYREHLEAFTGDLRPFYQAYKLIENYFGVYLAEK